MEPQDKDLFLQMLAKTMGAYSKSLQEAGSINSWLEILKPYPMNVIGLAFISYRDENGEFAPVPAGIAKRCKLMDGRPTADEAWAIALTSRNEEDTVVWTSETAEAFSICGPVLNAGDEVGARMAFRDAYNRLVAAARVSWSPASWNVSLGWNTEKRDVAIQRAQTAGLLSAPAAQVLLPNYSAIGEAINDSSPEGLQRVKEAVKQLQDGWTRNAELRAAEIEEQRVSVAEQKQNIAGQVADYEKNNLPMRKQA